MAAGSCPGAAGCSPVPARGRKTSSNSFCHGWMAAGSCLGSQNEFELVLKGLDGGRVMSGLGGLRPGPGPGSQNEFELVLSRLDGGGVMFGLAKRVRTRFARARRRPGLSGRGRLRPGPGPGSQNEFELVLPRLDGGGVMFGLAKRVRTRFEKTEDSHQDLRPGRFTPRIRCNFVAFRSCNHDCCTPETPEKHIHIYIRHTCVINLCAIHIRH